MIWCFIYILYICIYLSQLLSYFLLYLSQCRILTRWDRVTHKYVSDSTLIGSDNGLSPGRRQVIMRTITGILLKWSLGNKLQRHFNRNLYIFVQENAIENVIWKMAGILSRSQCVNSLGPSDAVWRWRSWSTLIQVTRCENKQFIRYHYNIDRPEEMQLIFTKATYRIKDPNQCMSYVHKDIVKTHLDPAECSETPPRLQAIFQRSVYTLIWRHVMTIWEDAATHCLKTDGTLIVPNSRQEYDFIWRSFIERYEIVLIPMGLRRYEVSTVQPMKYSVLLFFDTIFVVILSVLLDVVMMFYSHQNCCFGAILIVKDMGKIVRYPSKP